jgi:hypothetical protein
MENNLNPGEVICDECEGGRFRYDLDNYDIGKYNTCPKCHGIGKLDWVENVVGKKEPTYPGDAIIGDAYVNSNSNKIFVYDGAHWTPF